MIKVGDYVSGIEYYGHKKRVVQGWAYKIGKSKSDGTWIDIQADDEFNGARGTIIYSSLGPIEKLPDKPKLSNWREPDGQT